MVTTTATRKRILGHRLRPCVLGPRSRQMAVTLELCHHVLCTPSVSLGQSGRPLFSLGGVRLVIRVSGDIGASRLHL